MNELLLNYKLILGFLACIMIILRYYKYFKKIYLYEKKICFYSWFMWGLLALGIFFIQITNDGGFGSWVMLIGGIICFIFSGLSIKKGIKRINIFEILSIIAFGIIVFLLYQFNCILCTVVGLVFIDLLLYIPEIKKAIFKPKKQNPKIYILASLIYLMAFFALKKVTILTSLFFITNFFMFFLLFIITLFLRNFIIEEQKNT